MYTNHDPNLLKHVQQHQVEVRKFSLTEQLLRKLRPSRDLRFKELSIKGQTDWKGETVPELTHR